MRKVKQLLILALLFATPLAFAGRGALYNNTLSATGADIGISANNHAAAAYILQYTAVVTPATLSIKVQGSVLGDFSDAVDCGAASTNVTSGTITCTGVYAKIRANITTLTGASASINYTLTTVYNDAISVTGAASAQVQGSAAVGATAVGNPLFEGCVFNTTPATITNGQIGALQCNNIQYLLTSGRIEAGGSGTSGDGTSNSQTLGLLLDYTGSPRVLGVRYDWFNGATWDRPYYCNKTAFISGLAAATAQIVALSGATKIRVCFAHFANNSATATNVKFVEGTGANCGTGTADASGLIVLGANTLASDNETWNMGQGAALITATGGNALCVNGSAAGAVSVTITYAQF